ncbi:MAG: beta-N-acetylhexosaminidase [Tissierellaceae bacterium]|nr:beta-N-acetylhexosaminidase [Tissierellaceae bacterium]
MKKLFKLIIYTILFSFIIIGCTPQNHTLPVEPNPDSGDVPPIGEPEEIDKIQEQIDNMTLEEKVGQLLIVGFEGTELSDITGAYIEDLGVGGLIFFSRNIKSKDQVNTLVEEIKGSSNNIPLFLAIDEEGGKVSRMPQEYKKLPDSIDIGNTNDTDLAFEYGELLGNRVKSLGLNLNFAPVMDINSNPNNPVIGKRAFGTTPEIVSEMGLQVASGIRSTSVIPSIKHFPGHGDTSTDSHIELPVIEKNVDELKGFELKPFKAAIEEDIEMIMSAHILVPSIDEKYPATLSQKILGDLLRDEMGYDGVIISDDMTMGAIVNNYTLEEASIDFLKAGGDILLVCHGVENPRLVIDKILESIETGELTEDEINKKVYRILELKNRYLIEENIGIDIGDLNLKAEEIINNL